MDTVFIEQLKVETVIGVYDWEREIRQKLLIDMEMQFDCAAAGKSDDLMNALDYKAVADRVVEFVSSSDFQLIETIAERCCEMLLREFPVEKITFSIRKPQALSNADSVGVKIARCKSAQV